LWDQSAFEESDFSGDDKQFVFDELEDAVSRVKLDSAAGSDGFPARALKFVLAAVGQTWLCVV